MTAEQTHANSLTPAQQACSHDMVERVGSKLVCIGRVSHRADGDDYMESGCGAVIDVADWEESQERRRQCQDQHAN